MRAESRARRLAETARAAERNERAERLHGAQLLYGSDMHLASRLWEDGAAGRVAELLAAHEPKSGEEERRGFDWRYQWTLLNDGAVTLRGHGGAAYLGAFAPDGHLVTVDEDLQVRHWNRATRRPTRTVDLASESPLYRPALSHDGQTLAARTEPGDIRLLDTTTGRVKRVLKGHPAGSVIRFMNEGYRHDRISLAFSADDRRLASVGAFDRTARVWDLSSRREIQRIEGLETNLPYAASCTDLALSPDGRTLILAGYPAISSLNGVFDLSRPTAPAKLFLGHGSSVPCVALSPDGKTVASGEWATGVVILWDPVTLKVRHRLTAHSGHVWRLAFSPDGKTLATGGYDTRVKLWDVASGRLKRSLTGHMDQIIFLAFAADGKSLASGTRDGTAKIWDLTASSERRVLARHANDVQSLAYSPDGHLLAAGSGDRTVKILDPRTGRMMQTLGPLRAGAIRVAFSSDGRTLATGDPESEVRLWDVATGREKRPRRDLPVSRLAWQARPVGALSFSPDGRWLAAGFGAPWSFPKDYEPELRIWAMGGSHEARALKGHTNSISAIVFSPDGAMMATGSQDRTVKLWRVGAWQAIRTLTGFPDRVQSVTFTADGKTLAVGCLDGSTRFCDVATGRQTRLLRAHVLGWGATLSPDDRTLAMAGKAGTVHLWDVASGRRTRDFLNLGELQCVPVFSPDGNQLAAANEAGEVWVWEAASPGSIAAREAEERVAVRRLVETRDRDPRSPATLAWHQRLADDHQLKKQWPDALFHLDRLVEAKPSAWRHRVDRGRVLFQLDRRNEAENELARAASGDPKGSDLWMERGSAYAEQSRWDNAVADFTCAIDLGKGDPKVWYWRALAGLGGDLNEDYNRLRVRLLARVLVQRPNDPALWIERGRALAEQHFWPGAVASFTKAIALKPGASEPWIERARAHAEMGQWRPAAADFAHVLPSGDANGEWMPFHEAAMACLGSGDLAGYRDLCIRMLIQFGRTKDPDAAWGVALTCSLASNAVSDISRPVRLAERALAGEWPGAGPNGRYRAALALALYRAGRLDAALGRAKEAMAASPEGDNGANWLMLSMIHQRRGHAGEARRWLKKGLAWRVGTVPDWHDRLVYQLLRREARSLLGK